MPRALRVVKRKKLPPEKILVANRRAALYGPNRFPDSFGGTQMVVRAKCGMCGFDFRAKEHQAGHRVKCPKCGEPTDLPQAESSPGDAGAGWWVPTLVITIAAAISGGIVGYVVRAPQDELARLSAAAERERAQREVVEGEKSRLDQSLVRMQEELASLKSQQRPTLLISWSDLASRIEDDLPEYRFVRGKRALTDGRNAWSVKAGVHEFEATGHAEDAIEHVSLMIPLEEGRTKAFEQFARALLRLVDPEWAQTEGYQQLLQALKGSLAGQCATTFSRGDKRVGLCTIAVGGGAVVLIEVEPSRR